MYKFFLGNTFGNTQPVHFRLLYKTESNTTLLHLKHWVFPIFHALYLATLPFNFKLLSLFYRITVILCLVLESIHVNSRLPRVKKNDVDLLLLGTNLYSSMTSLESWKEET